jgi:hypothetical protein
MNIIPGLGRTLPPDRLTLRAMLILASQGLAFTGDGSLLASNPL